MNQKIRNKIIKYINKYLRKLNLICTKWNNKVNTKEADAVVCKAGSRSENAELFYNNVKLDIVTKFTLLDVTIYSKGKLYHSQKDLSGQALKAIYSLISLFDKVSLNVFHP